MAYVHVHKDLLIYNDSNYVAVEVPELSKGFEAIKAVARVRELHSETNGPSDDTTCKVCVVDEYNYPEYPCPTIKALDGK
jgi:hypothetical protein